MPTVFSDPKAHVQAATTRSAQRKFPYSRFFSDLKQRPQMIHQTRRTRGTTAARRRYNRVDAERETRAANEHRGHSWHCRIFHGSPSTSVPVCAAPLSARAPHSSVGGATTDWHPCSPRLDQRRPRAHTLRSCYPRHKEGRLPGTTGAPRTKLSG